MSLDAALLTARSGLLYTQRALATTADDIANAETPGHTDKKILGRAVLAGEMGLGIRSLPPRRDVDEALRSERDARQAMAAAAAERLRLLEGVEAAYGRPEAGEGLGDLIAALRAAFEDLRADPAEMARQATVLMRAEAVVLRFNAASAAVQKARQQAQEGIVAEIAAINAALREIAGLTRAIRDEIARGGSGAGLEDRRDAAIARLSESLPVKALKRADGAIVLVARSGLILPLDETASAFATAAATLGPAAYYGGGGTIPPITLQGVDVTSQLVGGRLAEYVALRDTTLPRYQAELDLAAAHLAARFDGQGLRLFTDPAGVVPDPALPYAGSAMVGFAALIRVNAAVRADPALLRDGTHAVAGSATGPSAFTPNPPGGPARFITLLDRVLDFTFGGEAQPGVGWGAIATAGLGPDGTLASPFAAPATLEAYGALLTAVHTADRRAAQAALAEAKALAEGLAARFAERAGVDVDQEMATMVALQNAYAANARLLATVQTMWDALFAAVR